ncbi:MAG: DsbC family protein [Hydrogenobacter thermophilus]|uniref:DsbC family protein n=1 Tax=Hydrogenobacter thermophilus TaxID=940 RepID=UPI001C73F743|nr:DsbC family protein [Hydrogenobacter thermophilus]QWK20670.1 MAG: DsbC family protein [Hydrogenobacter thermophilus]
MTKKLGILLSSTVLLAVSSSCGAPSAKCPSKDTVKNSVKDLIPQDFTVESVSGVKEISGLCEVVIKVGAQPLVFYTDSTGNYVVAGNIISLKDKKNLTRERQQEFTKVSTDQLKELEKHVNFTYGQGKKFIYYITDPDCPFCKKSEPILEDWAKKAGVQIKVILFPLPIHPQAFGKSVALVCDKKGWEELVKGYESKNQCDEGKKTITDNLQFLSQLGVNGTPTFVGMNGKMQSGVPTEEDLNKLIN